MHTWRQRAKDMIKWADNGGLEAKLAYLKRKTPYVHVGREWRAAQIEQVLANPTLLKVIRDDLRRTHISFSRMEAIRISIPKHEIRGRPNAIPQMATHGRINRWCGSIDFELEHEGVVLGTISRRDIADELRSIPGPELPTDDEIREFDEFMRGPPADFWDDDRLEGREK